MSFSYDINNTNKDKSSSACLVITHSISQIINLFITTFLVAYIYSLSSDVLGYIYNVGIYYLSYCVTMAIVYFLLVFIVEKTNRVWLFRIGLVIRMAFVIMLVFCGQNLAKLLVLAGVLYGAESAFYYSSYNSIKQEMVSRNSMGKFVLIVLVLNNIINIVVPIVMGALIQVSTYSQVAIAVAIICLIQIGISFGIKSKRPENSKFSLKGYFIALKQNKEAAKKINLIYLAIVFYGFTTIVNILAKVVLMLQNGTNLQLGTLQSVLGVITIVVALLVSKFTKAGKRSWLFIVAAIIPCMVSILYVTLPSMTTVIVYNVLMTVSYTVYDLYIDIYRNSNLKEAGLYDYITEHQTIVEMLLALSRIVSFGLMIIVSLIGNITLFYIMFVVFSLLAYSALLIVLAIYERKYMQPEIGQQQTAEMAG